MARTDLKGEWGLVTGASSGLGVDVARELASRGMNVIIVARRQDRLEEVAQALRHDFSVQATNITMDLAQPGSAAELYEQVRAQGRDVRVLVNNAGFGIFGDFVHIPRAREAAMLQLDIITLVELTKYFARDMIKEGNGYILQVASVGAYQPAPTYASYSAAKAFVLNFGEAINYELRGTGVSCTVVSPGITKTEFLAVSGQEANFFHRALMMTSPAVARIAIRAMLRRKSSLVPGFINAFLAWSVRFTPRRWATATAHFTMTIGGDKNPRPAISDGEGPS